MILVFLGMSIVCLVLIWRHRFEDGFNEFMSKGAGICLVIVCFLITTGYLHKVIELNMLDTKIEMYSKENSQIEIQIADCIKSYQEYETQIFTDVAPDSSMTLVALYPELKSDTLVATQINTYIQNNNKIKSLKEEKINGRLVRWWLYFGK